MESLKYSMQQLSKFYKYSEVGTKKSIITQITVNYLLGKTQPYILMMLLLIGTWSPTNFPRLIPNILQRNLLL